MYVLTVFLMTRNPYIFVGLTKAKTISCITGIAAFKIFRPHQNFYCKKKEHSDKIKNRFFVLRTRGPRGLLHLCKCPICSMLVRELSNIKFPTRRNTLDSTISRKHNSC